MCTWKVTALISLGGRLALLTGNVLGTTKSCGGCTPGPARAIFRVPTAVEPACPG